MPDPTSVSEQFKRAMAIAWKDIRIYYGKGPVVIIGLLLPAFLFLSFSIGRNLSAQATMPGLIGMALFFTAASMSPIITPFESQQRTLERLMAAPVSFQVIILGDIIASFLFGILVSILPVAATFILGVAISNLLVFILAIILGALCFSALGNVFSIPPTSTPQTANMLASSIKFPLIFISGVFIPLGELPVWGRVLSYFSPITYFTDIARYSIQGQGYLPVAVDFAALAGFTVLFLVLAMRLHQNTMPKRI
jgi:ABC-2 type transport system permease protein